ncbi:MAG: thermonuclease family protein [Nitrososphaeraceae archaeon]
MNYLIISIILVIAFGIVTITPYAFAEKLDQLDGTILKSVCESIHGTAMLTSDIQNAPIELCKFGNRNFKIVYYYACTENVVKAKDPDTGIVYELGNGCSVPQSCIPNYAWIPPSRMDHHDKLTVEIEKKSFTIVTDIDDGICSSLAFNTLEKKVSIISKGVWENNTTISVLIPKELMRGEFEVKLDGKKTNSIISDTWDYCTPYVPDCRILYSKVDVKVGSVIDERKIEITGTQLIPEFTPRQQISNGVLPEDVICKEGLELIFKSRDNSPACVKPQTAQKLVDRGWGTTSISSIQKTWVETYPIGCMNYTVYSVKGCYINWLADYYGTNDRILMPPQAFENNSTLLSFEKNSGYIKDYFGKQGIGILDVKYNRIGQGLCELCECWDKYSLRLLVSNSTVQKMLDFVFKISENQITDIGDFSCSGSATCFQGTINRIIDGDTLEIDGTTIRLALTSTPELGTEIGNKAKEFLTINCPVGSKAVVDEDDLQTNGSYGRMLAKVYCERGMLNAALLDNNLAVIDKRFCSTSEFSGEDWAKKYGC